MQNNHFVHFGVELFDDFSFHFDSFFHSKFYFCILDFAYLFLLFFGHLVLFAPLLKYCAYLHLTDKVVQKGYPNVVSLRPWLERESGRRRAKVKWLWNDAKG